MRIERHHKVLDYPETWGFIRGKVEVGDIIEGFDPVEGNYVDRTITKVEFCEDHPLGVCTKYWCNG